MPLGRLLFLVLILGIIAYAVQALKIPSPFNVVAWAILMIILLILLFAAAGVNTGFSF